MRSIVDIESIVPVEVGIWFATLVVRVEDEIGGIKVNQVVKAQVRITQEDSASIESLLQSVYDRARSTLADASAVLENSTIAELRLASRPDPFV